jgi:uncharacterized protein
MGKDAAAVVDAWALLAFLRREGEAGATMRRYLRRAAAGNLRLLMNLVNLCETYYRLVQVLGRPEADERLRLIRRLPIAWVPVREALAVEAGLVKAAHRMALGDAFAVATARLERAALLTGDPEVLALPREFVRVVRLAR